MGIINGLLPGLASVAAADHLSEALHPRRWWDCRAACREAPAFKHQSTSVLTLTPHFVATAASAKRGGMLLAFRVTVACHHHRHHRGCCRGCPKTRSHYTPTWRSCAEVFAAPCLHCASPYTLCMCVHMYIHTWPRDHVSPGHLHNSLNSLAALPGCEHCLLALAWQQQPFAGGVRMQ